LQDYADQSDNEEDFDEEEESFDEDDDSGEEYVGGRYKKSRGKTNKRGGARVMQK